MARYTVALLRFVLCIISGTVIPDCRKDLISAIFSEARGIESHIVSASVRGRMEEEFGPPMKDESDERQHHETRKK
jgi:hypothetical protein